MSPVRDPSLTVRSGRRPPPLQVVRMGCRKRGRPGQPGRSPTVGPGSRALGAALPPVRRRTRRGSRVGHGHHPPALIRGRRGAAPCERRHVSETASIAERTVHTATASITVRAGPASRPTADFGHAPGAVRRVDNPDVLGPAAPVTCAFRPSALRIRAHCTQLSRACRGESGRYAPRGGGSGAVTGLLLKSSMLVPTPGPTAGSARGPFRNRPVTEPLKAYKRIWPPGSDFLNRPAYREGRGSRGFDLAKCDAVSENPQCDGGDLHGLALDGVLPALPRACR